MPARRCRSKCRPPAFVHAGYVGLGHSECHSPRYRPLAPIFGLLELVRFVCICTQCVLAPRAARQACDTKQNWEEPVVAHRCGSHCCWCCQVRVDEEADEKVRRKFLGAEAKPRPGSRGKVYEMPERVRAPSSNSRHCLIIASPVLNPPHGARVCLASSTELRR